MTKWYVLFKASGKYLFAITVILMLSGCHDIKHNVPTSAYMKFLETHNGSSVSIDCKDGFLIKTYISQGWDSSSEEVIINDADQPVRCNENNVKIQVKETVATGSLVGSTH